jgi:hypothetical protein
MRAVSPTRRWRIRCASARADTPVRVGINNGGSARNVSHIQSAPGERSKEVVCARSRGASPNHSRRVLGSPPQPHNLRPCSGLRPGGVPFRLVAGLSSVDAAAARATYAPALGSSGDVIEPRARRLFQPEVLVDLFDRVPASVDRHQTSADQRRPLTTWLPTAITFLNSAPWIRPEAGGGSPRGGGRRQARTCARRATRL